MEAEEALTLLDELVLEKNGKRLNDLQQKIFVGSWQGENYDEISKKRCYDHYSADHIGRNVGPNLWRMLTRVLEEKVSKKNLQGTC